jgi:hypothetical protein
MAELDDAVYEASAEAFGLAKEAADEGQTPERQAKALELAGRVNALMPQAEARGGDDQTLVRELTEARLDIGWVYNLGRGPTSTRLFQHLRSADSGG